MQESNPPTLRWRVGTTPLLTFDIVLVRSTLFLVAISQPAHHPGLDASSLSPLGHGVRGSRMLLAHVLATFRAAVPGSLFVPNAPKYFAGTFAEFKNDDDSLVVRRTTCE